MLRNWELMCSEQGKCWLQWLLFARSSHIQYPISISRDLYCITQAEALANKIHVYPSLWGLFINDVITLRGGGDWGMITMIPWFFFPGLGLGLVKLARRGALLNKEGFREVGGEGDVVSVLFLSLSLSELQLFLFYARWVQCLNRTWVGWKRLPCLNK